MPTATDIAFAVGVLVFLGKAIPGNVRVLLLALAIIDDIIAVLIIAFFYSGDWNTAASPSLLSASSWCWSSSAWVLARPMPMCRRALEPSERGQAGRAARVHHGGAAGDRLGHDLCRRTSQAGEGIRRCAINMVLR